MGSFALAAIGRDRPGIVAAVSRILFERGCNVEDSSMTLLRGNFAMMLVFSGPTTAEDMSAALDPVCSEFGLTSSVLEIDDRPVTPDPTQVLTVYGADKPGILAGITEALAARSVNITDLNSRLAGGVYALLLELELPAGADAKVLAGQLEEVAARLGVDISLQDRDADIL